MIDKDQMLMWLDDEQFEEYGDGVKTPRDWLREALKTSLMGAKRPMGNPEWAYELAITMVPAFPEIVIDYQESGEDIEFTFDWKVFDRVLLGTIDSLISGNTQ